MGIIIDSGRARLQFKGSLSEFEKVKGGLEKIRKIVGAETLMIDTIPLPDRGNIVDLKFKGELSEFGKVIGGLQDLHSKYAIDTVPLPEKLMIGSWPTPEELKGHLYGRFVPHNRVIRYTLKSAKSWDLYEYFFSIFD